MYWYTKFEKPSFILSLDIVRKPLSTENWSTAPVTLKSRSRSTICNPMRAPKVMYLHTKFEEPSFILAKDILRKPPSIENQSTALVTLKSGSRLTIWNPMLAPKVMYLNTKFEKPCFSLPQDIVRKLPKSVNNPCDLEKWVKVNHLQPHASSQGDVPIHEFREPSFILSQDIVRKCPSIENWSTAPVTLKSRSRSTICNPVLAPKVMYVHTKFEEPSLNLSQDITDLYKSLQQVNFSEFDLM